MKKTVLLLLIAFPMLSFAVVKTWVGNAGDNWANNNSWSPTGTPAATDDVVFNTSATVLFTATINALKSLKISNTATVLFQAGGAFYIGYVTAPKFNIDAGATLQIRGINLANAGVTIIINGDCEINGLLDLQGGAGSQLQIFSGTGTTAKLTVNGKIRTGFLNIGGTDADAGILYAPDPNSSVINFTSGSQYEIAKRDATSIPIATWAPDAVLKITGAQATSGFYLGWAGSQPSDIGTVIWDCPNQGGDAGIYLGDYPYVLTVKGDFVVNNTNGKVLSFKYGNSGSYTTTFKGNFEVKSASTTIEMFRTAYQIAGNGIGTWVFEKNVNILGKLTSGNNTSSDHMLRFKGSATGAGGTGAQTFAVGGFLKPWVISIRMENDGNGIILNSDVWGIRSIYFLYSAIGTSKIILGNHDITVGGNGGIISGGGNGFVVTNGTGFLRVPLSIGTPQEFPVGPSEISYDPAGISSNTQDTFAVQVRSGFSHPVAKTDYVYDREWNIVSKSTDAQVEVYPNQDPEVLTPPTATGDYVIGHYTGGGWVETPAVCCGPVFFSTFAANFTSFSPFAVGIATGFGTGSSSGTTYTFNGYGNWSEPANWSNGTLPPATINPGDKIIINPGDGLCILDVPYTVPAGAELTVSPGKILRVNGNLTVH